jgi:hypothetical protein
LLQDHFKCPVTLSLNGESRGGAHHACKQRESGQHTYPASRNNSF